jgi:hypothetical protein
MPSRTADAHGLWVCAAPGCEVCAAPGGEARCAARDVCGHAARTSPPVSSSTASRETDRHHRQQRDSRAPVAGPVFGGQQCTDQVHPLRLVENLEHTHDILVLDHAHDLNLALNVDHILDLALVDDLDRNDFWPFLFLPFLQGALLHRGEVASPERLANLVFLLEGGRPTLGEEAHLLVGARSAWRCVPSRGRASCVRPHLRQVGRYSVARAWQLFPMVGSFSR